MKIITDFNNTLLKRREVKVIMEAPSNPGFEKALNLVAQQFKVNEDTIVIKTLKSKFGRDTFLIDAFIYDSTKDKFLIEPRIKVKKTGTENASAGVSN